MGSYFCRIEKNKRHHEKIKKSDRQRQQIQAEFRKQPPDQERNNSADDRMKAESAGAPIASTDDREMQGQAYGQKQGKNRQTFP
ncbi:hypothetical protein GCM10007972_13730 [Iodidimonas muriae]|uniref:Uncharacterized protein n=1 Tax=Iodidimonas muriae TaxID=261467 RepID=A0ABQ2LCV7_9PROT|nr:hypothetical protein GCM10007972_13730 [Iodidimonas muriae]